MKVAFFTFLLSAVTIMGCSQEETFDQMIDNTIGKTVELFYPDSMSCDDCVFLDTRKKEEFEVSHIEGAQFIEYNKFKLKDVKDIDKDEKIVVYCTVGYRSEKIGEKLLEAGYTNVYNLYGGIFEWKNTGNEVVDQEGNSTDKVHCYNKNWSKWLEKGEKIY